MSLKQLVDGMTPETLQRLRQDSGGLYSFMNELKHHGTPSMVQKLLQMAPWTEVYLSAHVRQMVMEYQQADVLVDFLQAIERVDGGAERAYVQLRVILSDVFHEETHRLFVEEKTGLKTPSFPLQSFVRDLVTKKDDLLNDLSWARQTCSKSWRMPFEFLLVQVLTGLTQGLPEPRRHLVLQDVLNHIQPHLAIDVLDVLFGCFPLEVKPLLEGRFKHMTEENQQRSFALTPRYHAEVEKGLLLKSIGLGDGSFEPSLRDQPNAKTRHRKI